MKERVEEVVGGLLGEQRVPWTPKSEEEEFEDIYHETTVEGTLGGL